MQVIAPGDRAPEVPGVNFGDGPVALWFYKVTCPVCQMAAPKAEALAQAYPARVHGIGQDPELKLISFGEEFGQMFETQADLPPYRASNAYGIRVVPTAVLVDDGGTVRDVVESWDREGINRLAGALAELTGSPAVTISEPGDGLPPFRPG
jgi:thiol-disulfide isomerase/thioredoxin